MTKELFIETYVLNFIATWTATNYTDYCTRSLYKELANPPIEDAVDLAEVAWRLMLDEGVIAAKDKR